MLLNLIVEKHSCGHEYCLIKIDCLEISFSFSLTYFFEMVKPEHYEWFLNDVIKNYLDDESFQINNVHYVIDECTKIYKETI